MPQFLCDGVTLDIADSGSISLVKGLIEKRDNQIADLESKLDGQKYKVGEKEYTDMGLMVKDMSKYYSDMQMYKKKYEDMCAESKKNKDSQDVLQAKCDALENKPKPDILEEATKLVRLGNIASSRLDGFTFDDFSTKTPLEVKQEIVRADGLDPAKYTEDGLDIIIDVLSGKNMDNDQVKTQRKTFGTKRVNNAPVSHADSDDEIWGWVEDSVEAVENAWTEDLQLADQYRTSKRG